jgi:kynurenine formamidase
MIKIQKSIFLFILLSLMLTSIPNHGVAQNTSDSITLTKEIINQWTEELSNWGHWGENDELGTLNLITPQKRKNAASLVREGISVSLARDIPKETGPNTPTPLKHNLSVGEWTGHMWAGDEYTMEYHGFAYSHIDALCHIFYKKKMYNGFSQDLVKPNGAEKLDIQKMNKGIFTRGVLVDIPRLKGVPYLKPGDTILPEDIEAWEEEMEIKIKSDDVLLIRTGRWACEKEEGSWDFTEKAAGLHPTIAKWLKERDVSVLGSDGVNDRYPSEIEGVSSPIHQLLLVGLGMPLLDNLQLEDLASMAASLNRWEFLFVAVPLRIPGGTGSPLNPIATF